MIWPEMTKALWIFSTHISMVWLLNRLPGNLSQHKHTLNTMYTSYTHFYVEHLQQCHIHLNNSPEQTESQNIGLVPSKAWDHCLTWYNYGRKRCPEKLSVFWKLVRPCSSWKFSFEQELVSILHANNWTIGLVLGSFWIREGLARSTYMQT